MNRFLRTLSFTAIALAALPVNAYAANAEQQRIERLERELSTMQRMLYGQAAYGVNDGYVDGTQNVSAGSGAAQAIIQINQLQEQIRQLNGKLEQVEFANKTLSTQLEKFMADVEYRFNNLPPAAPTTIQLPTQEKTVFIQKEYPNERRDPTGNAIAAAASPTAPVTDRPLTTQEQYDYAFGLLNQSRFEEAEAALKKFIEQHPQDNLASNAYYWLGETYYVRKKYEDAAVQFLKGYQAFPKGPKAPDSMLKLGLSLDNLGKKKEACTTLAKLQKEYPNVEAALKQRVESETKRLTCSA